MRLNLTTDYAIRVLIYLATDETRLHAVGDVSRAYAMPHSTVMKVVSDLVRQGFVDSVRGRSGGIRFSRPAAEISLSEIIAAAEDSMVIADCGTCVLAPRCRLKSIFAEAVAAFIAVLRRYTLSDVTENPDELLALFHHAPQFQTGCATAGAPGS
ncbi:Rrf2 family transcriptional regulator [Paracoccus sp. DMF-8]|uniref:RrF2 family transcriptional regulator n=1 Tax=Paracoccus sp. DMF-8 TaxID=3019445 RepID=UPI0023E88DBE|nr:Rrf2 family transcriptional regulator [Paracoccus sp. DMF-8]MDF3607059.1 Rrf2 family transcriptional regulator [Paracoccus sp. DMF-8]